MAKVRFTSALTRFFPDLVEMDIQAKTVREALLNIEQKHPGILSYLVEDNGQLRRHVNIFRGEDLIRDRQALTDTIEPNDEILIFQALSGG